MTRKETILTRELKFRLKTAACVWWLQQCWCEQEGPTIPNGGVPDGEERAAACLGSGWPIRASGGLSPSIITKQLSGLWCSEFGATKTLLLCPQWLLWPQEPCWLPDDRGSLQKGDENRILEKCEVHDSRGTGRKSPLAPATHLNEVDSCLRS